MPLSHLGCCGAYCAACKVFAAGPCKGCKLGYDTLERDITKAKCSYKVCCIKKGLGSCAECGDYDTCESIQSFHNRSGYKYGKYKQAVAFIREHGYDKFFDIADTWTNAYGKYK